MRRIPVMIEAKGTRGDLAKLTAEGAVLNTNKDGKPSWQNIAKYAVTDEELEREKLRLEDDIERKLKALNQMMHEKPIELDVASRVEILAGMVMAGLGVPGRVSPLKADDLRGELGESSHDGQVIMNKIRDYLREKGLPDEKRQTIVNLLSTKFIDESLYRPADGESKLKTIYREVKKNIMPFLTGELHNIDFTGRLFNVMNDWVKVPDHGENDVVLTPRYVTELMARLCEVNMDSYVWDFATDSAGFLISAMNLMIADARQKLHSPEEIQRKEQHIKMTQLLGIEKLSDIYMLAVLNMILMKDGSANIINGDSPSRTQRAVYPSPPTTPPTTLHDPLHPRHQEAGHRPAEGRDRPRTKSLRTSNKITQKKMATLLYANPSYMRRSFAQIDDAISTYCDWGEEPNFEEGPFAPTQIERLKGSLYAAHIVIHLLDYIGAGMKASDGGLPEAYRLFYDYNPEVAAYDGWPSAPLFILGEELQKALRHEIFTAEMLARLPMHFVKRIVSAMSAEDPSALVDELLNLAQVVTRRVDDLFSQTPTDDEVLQVYAVREEFYLEHAYEADKEAYEKWTAGIAKKNRRREGERRKAHYREQLFKTHFLDEIAADLPSFEEPIPDGQADEEWEQSLHLEALRELTGEDGQPDRDAVGRHLLRWREQLTDGDIMAYFRYVHMSAYIDGLQPRGSAKAEPPSGFAEATDMGRESAPQDEAKDEEIVLRLASCFFGKTDEAASFLTRIRGMKPTQITQLVTQLVEERTISDLSYGRELWSVLHRYGLYARSESNWNGQINPTLPPRK